MNEMESMFRSFFWGKKKDEKKLAWVVWQKMYAPKKGGSGMRNLPAFIKALLAKQAWRIIKYPHSLMAKTLANKYLPHSTLLYGSKGEPFG